MPPFPRQRVGAPELRVAPLCCWHPANACLRAAFSRVHPRRPGWTCVGGTAPFTPSQHSKPTPRLACAGGGDPGLMQPLPVREEIVNMSDSNAGQKCARRPGRGAMC